MRTARPEERRPTSVGWPRSRRKEESLKAKKMALSPRKVSLMGVQPLFFRLCPLQSPFGNGDGGVEAGTGRGLQGAGDRLSCLGQLPGHGILPVPEAWDRLYGQTACTWGPGSSQAALILAIANSRAS